MNIKRKISMIYLMNIIGRFSILQIVANIDTAIVSMFETTHEMKRAVFHQLHYFMS